MNGLDWWILNISDKYSLRLQVFCTPTPPKESSHDEKPDKDHIEEDKEGGEEEDHAEHWAWNITLNIWWNQDQNIVLDIL